MRRRPWRRLSPRPGSRGTVVTSRGTVVTLLPNDRAVATRRASRVATVVGEVASSTTVGSFEVRDDLVYTVRIVRPEPVILVGFPFFGE